MSERLDRIERTIEAMLAMQADFEVKAQMRREQEEERQRKTDAKMDQLKRVLLLAIKESRRFRTETKYNIAALMDSHLSVEDRIARLEAQRKSLYGGNGQANSDSNGPNRT